MHEKKRKQFALAFWLIYAFESFYFSFIFFSYFLCQGQFNFAEVLIKPLDNASNMVSLRFKDELKDLLTDTGPRVISDDNLPRLVRQLVVHINVSQCHALLSVQIFSGKKSNKIFDDLVKLKFSDEIHYEIYN